MAELDAAKVQQAVFKGLAPLKERVARVGLSEVSKAWGAFVSGPTAKLLGGDITIDDWKGELGSFCQRAATTKISPQEIQGILADANGAVIIVEESFAPSPMMRWLLIGGAAAAAFAWWWMKREEKRQQRLLIANPKTAGTPRAQRQPEEIEEVELEEV